MSRNTSVHALSVPVAFGGRELTITPTVVETDRGPILVDVGPDGVVESLASHLADLDISLDDLWLVVLTHHDSDHAGGLAELRDRTDVVVAAHRDEAPFVRGDRNPLKGDGDRYPPTPVDVELTGDVRFATDAGPMVIVETPGHTPGHVSLYFPDAELLLAGDALVSDGEEPLSGPKPAFTPDTDRAVESVVELGELDVAQTVCFHGGFVPEGTSRIRALADDLRE